METYRSTIPKTADELWQLGDLIVAQTEQAGNASPLQILPMDEFATLLNTVKADKIERDRLQREVHMLTERYSQGTGLSKGQGVGTPDTVLHFITMARDVLLGVNKGKERKLGDYGFDVLGGSQKTKVAAPSTALGGEIGIDEDGVNAA